MTNKDKSVNSNKLFSCIVPTLNEKDTINEFIVSFQSQDYRPMELLVVDGGSIDGTQEIVHKQISALNDSSFTILFFNEKEFGEISSPANARNIGLDNVKGEYVLFIDSDTVFMDSSSISKALSEIGKSDFIVISFEIIIDTLLEKKISRLLDAGVAFVYKRKFIGDVRFTPTLGFGEDREFNYHLFGSVTGPTNALSPSVTIGRHFPHTKKELKSQNQWYGRTISRYILAMFRLHEKDFISQSLYVILNILLVLLPIMCLLFILVNPLLSLSSLLLSFILVVARSRLKLKSIGDLIFGTWYYIYSAFYFTKGFVSSFKLGQKIGRY
ncbi:MAG: hypothetical protein PWQ75_1042 [Methanolobus sp.]|uniref:glycosyltransferase family 2 protein n=1 Tax=Methanolobus sp. TaxID=1874737 RepID=UPI002588AF34|nr:glycosyltransferase [Methanolobus sp.]MDK2831290.1 hypothetical protein [Methanolobus sp.]